jgi:FtsP/CotA-like multicopper oxidase with cupredoxin domain
VMPWEAGGKDTVLLHPFETVRVAVRFTAHRGLFLLHCHNLEHEDMGMMANILVE